MAKKKNSAPAGDLTLALKSVVISHDIEKYEQMCSSKPDSDLRSELKAVSNRSDVSQYGLKLWQCEYGLIVST
jgi:hypothetical protein